MLYKHSPNVAVRAIDAIVATKGLRFISQLYAEIFVVCYLVYLHGWDSSQFLRLILKLTNWRTCRICSEGLCLFYVALLFSLLNGNILLQSLQVQAQIYWTVMKSHHSILKLSPSEIPIIDLHSLLCNGKLCAQCMNTPFGICCPTAFFHWSQGTCQPTKNWFWMVCKHLLFEHWQLVTETSGLRSGGRYGRETSSSFHREFAKYWLDGWCYEGCS